MKRQVNIDKVNIRLPHGWQGDSAQLARDIANQLQQQASELSDAKQIDLTLRGHYAGSGKQVAEQFGQQLPTQTAHGKGRKIT